MWVSVRCDQMNGQPDIHLKSQQTVMCVCNAMTFYAKLETSLWEMNDVSLCGVIFDYHKNKEKLIKNIN